MLTKSGLLLILALLIVSCAPQVAPATSTPRPTLIPSPTAPFKEIEYKLLGREEEGRFVVIDPKFRSDREALQFVINELCKGAQYCAIHFWDDERYAVKSALQMTAESRNARVAFYGKDKALGESLELFK